MALSGEAGDIELVTKKLGGMIIYNKLGLGGSKPWSTLVIGIREEKVRTGRFLKTSTYM